MDQNFHVYIHSKSKNDPPFMFLLFKEAKIDLLIIAYPPSILQQNGYTEK